MPVPGRKPKSPDERRNRVPPRHDWVEVVNVPFEGRPIPEWKPRYNVTGGKGDVVTLPTWPDSTREWWAAISTMPHAALWGEAEWQFAANTALLVAAFHMGELRYAPEIRTRETTMGTTADRRRDLRIRYVDPRSSEIVDGADVASVTAMADYARMVDDA